MEMEPWKASELSFGGAGAFWCFTELQRSGEKVSRKTGDGQTWSSKSGRGPKNGYPDEIRVDTLVITGKEFDMIELTLNQEKPTIALCKIRWRKSNSAVSSPQTPKPSVFSPESTTSLQVLEDHFHIDEEPTEMQIDQPQGGQLEGLTQQEPMPGNTMSIGCDIMPQDSSGGCIHSIGPDVDPTYQEAVTFLHRMKGSFNQVVTFHRDEACKIASTVQAAAESLKNLLSFLRINEPESTSDSTQLLMEPAPSSVANPAAIAPEMTAQDEFPDQELGPVTSWSMEDSFFDVAVFLNLDGGNGTNSDSQQGV